MCIFILIRFCFSIFFKIAYDNFFVSSFCFWSPNLTSKYLLINCYGSYLSGFTREVNGSGPFGHCVLCSCNNRSTQCDSETGVCINCQVGTYGNHCELCTNNVQGPECRRCKPGYWGLSESGCKGTNTDQHLRTPPSNGPGTSFSKGPVTFRPRKQSFKSKSTV